MSNQDFDAMAIELFRFQAEANPLYREYLSLINCKVEQVDRIEAIPFLPITFFKTHEVRSTSRPVEKVFKSSGTTAQVRSQHFVSDLELYHMVARLQYEEMVGSLEDLVIIAILPSYQENGGSSLVDMVDYFMKIAGSRESRYFKEDWPALSAYLKGLAGRKVLLIGVSYALLDFAASGLNGIDTENTIIMETGGMKGRHQELVRAELHEIFKKSWQVETIWSEYGMTELLSQAYAPMEGVFNPGKTMRVMIREISDPLCVQRVGTGGLNVIDLANIDSCAFIETADQGKVGEDGTFVVLGRIDNSEMRGCNLLYVQ